MVEGARVPSDLTLRVKSLESLLVEKGLVDPAALDALIDTMEHKVGPRNGARVVARAWMDPAYKQLPEDVEVRVWDSTAELRYLVLPERPAGTEMMNEEQLASLITRDAMVGVAKVTLPSPLFNALTARTTCAASGTWVR